MDCWQLGDLAACWGLRYCYCFPGGSGASPAVGAVVSATPIPQVEKDFDEQFEVIWYDTAVLNIQLYYDFSAAV